MSERREATTTDAEIVRGFTTTIESFGSWDKMKAANRFVDVGVITKIESTASRLVDGVCSLCLELKSCRGLLPLRCVALAIGPGSLGSGLARSTPCASDLVALGLLDELR